MCQVLLEVIRFGLNGTLNILYLPLQHDVWIHINLHLVYQFLVLDDLIEISYIQLLFLIDKQILILLIIGHHFVQDYERILVEFANIELFFQLLLLLQGRNWIVYVEG